MPDLFDPETRDLLALSLVPGLGPRLTEALIQRFGSAAAVRKASAADLRSVPHVGEKLSAAFADSLRNADVDAELEALSKHGVRLLMKGRDGYPASLVELPDAPYLLFVRGELQTCDARAVAIVGSRHCTAYGRRVAEKMASDLARAGVTVVSGLARGIDGCAHRGALAAGGRTIAVLAGGLSRIYPPEHAELAEDVVRSGALITETSTGQPPQAGLFPARNRLISGLSLGVVIIEAGERSGALITARHAAEQGRDLFAVPGTVDSAASAGSLELLRNGAKMVRSAADVLEDLGGVKGAKAEPTLFPPPPEMDDCSRRVWDLLADQPRFMDEIVARLSLPVHELATLLMRMEMKRLVRRLPGNRYERV